MKKLDFILLSISYILGVCVAANSVNPYVSNPHFSDHVVSGLGSFVAAFIMASIVSLPIQFFSGWSRHGYVRKTLMMTTGLLTLLLVKTFL